MRPFVQTKTLGLTLVVIYVSVQLILGPIYANETILLIKFKSSYN